MHRGLKGFLFTILFLFFTNLTAYSLTFPEINAKSAISLDIDTGEIIYAKDIDSKYYPASITKLMTALLLAENRSESDELIYTKDAKTQQEYSLNTNVSPISVGENISAKDAMSSLLLYSANDIATMVADNLGGSTTGFAKIMNEEAKKLNMNSTNFVTPNGLHAPNHYTTPYDLTLLGRASLSNPWMKETMGKKTDSITLHGNQKFTIDNRNKLLGIDGCIAGKTGYTDPAGRCLLAIYERNSRRIIGVVMKSIYDEKDNVVFEDMKKIIDWSFNVKPVILYNKSASIKNVDLSYKPLKFIGPTKTIQVPMIIQEDVVYYDNYINEKELNTEIQMNDLNPWKLDINKSEGKLMLKQRENIKNFPIYPGISTMDIIRANELLYLSIGIIAIAIIIISIMVSFLAIRRKKSSTVIRRNFGG